MNGRTTMLLGLTGLLLAAEAVSASPVTAGVAKTVAVQAEMPLIGKGAGG